MSGKNRTVVKLYDVVRTAHMERINPGNRTIIIFKSRRYDFDAAVAGGVDLKNAGVFGTFLYLLRRDVDTLEINEPLEIRSAPRSLAAIAANRLRARLRRGPRARVVTYAIAVMDPLEIAPHIPLRSRLKLRVHYALLPAVWRRVDRLAYGTDLAQQAYARVPVLNPDRGPEQTLIHALPQPEAEPAALDSPRSRVLLFLGDLSPRKGFPLVVAAWQSVHEALPDARLHVVGRGVGVDAALALAAGDSAVTVEVDPPRSLIHEALRRAKVVALPSQPTPVWREQVGLPIVEGLASGCLVVTTDQTGLAPWLKSHGHYVLDTDLDAEDLAHALIEALRDPRHPGQLVMDLPIVDGRRAAEDWLFGAAPHAEDV